MMDAQNTEGLAKHFAILTKYGSKIRFLGYSLILIYLICLGLITWKIVQEYPYFASGIQIEAEILGSEAADEACSGCSKLRIAFEYEYFDHVYEFIEDIFVDEATLNAWTRNGKLLVTYVEVKPEAYIIGTAFHDWPLILGLLLWSVANLLLGIYLALGGRALLQAEQGTKTQMRLAANS
jgi:hypothetical protein